MTQAEINGTQSQVPFEVTDPEAPVTQAQLAAMFQVILEAARTQCNDRDRELLFSSIGVRSGANFGFGTGFEDLIFG